MRWSLSALSLFANRRLSCSLQNLEPGTEDEEGGVRRDSGVDFSDGALSHEEDTEASSKKQKHRGNKKKTGLELKSGMIFNLEM